MNTIYKILWISDTLCACFLASLFCFFLPAEFEAAVVWRRDGERPPLPGARNVRQCRRAPARRQLLGPGHPPARHHPPFLRPFSGQAGVRGLQRAAAHVPLLHEGPVLGGRRLAAGSGARILWPQTATHQELAGRGAALH